jgi:uncharacterized membrane protein YidH (DUF202 family)
VTAVGIALALVGFLIIRLAPVNPVEQLSRAFKNDAHPTRLEWVGLFLLVVGAASTVIGLLRWVWEVLP